MNEGTSADSSDDLRATQLITGLGSYSSGLQRMGMFNDIEKIGFENEAWLRQDGTILFPIGSSTTCLYSSCQLFHPQGAGVAPLVLDKDFQSGAGLTPAATEPAFGSPYIAFAVVQNVSTSLPDLVAFYDDISPRVCRQVNKRLFGDSEFMPVDTFSGYSLFNGTVPTTSTAIIGDQAPQLKGQHIFAFKRDANVESCTVLQVLLAR